MHIVLPHADQVFWTNDERFRPVVVLKNSRQRYRHERLAEADHISNHHAAAFV